ncbi:MAG: hypothetical protein WCP39_06525 [Chlamydiota bacterium]
MSLPVTLKDFIPWNQWEITAKGADGGSSYIYENGKKIPEYLIDKTTGKLYWNETKKVVRVKCFLLTLGTPFVHATALIINIAYRIFKLLTFSHFRMQGHHHFKAHLLETGKDLLRIIAAPLVFFGLELSAIYGLFTPYNGRKLYASFERAEYGNRILAPCFQPNAQSHLFGGDPSQRDSF